MLFPRRDHNPAGRRPYVTTAIVIASAAVFLWQAFGLPPREARALVLAGGAIPFEITHLVDLVGAGQVAALVPPPLTIFTSMFLHGSVAHVLGNMWFLWIFGDNVEDALGHGRYLLFYLLVGAAGAVAQSLWDPASREPMIGASGAIAGVMGAYLVLYPAARVDAWLFIPVLGPVVALPAFLFLAVWFVGQFFIDPSARVAWLAHVGGFVAGFVLIRILAPRDRPRRAPDWEA